MAEFSVDSSVIIAIHKRERGFEIFNSALLSGHWCIGFPTILEIRIWETRNNDGRHLPTLDAMFADPTISRIPFDANLEPFASAAYARFGKGRHAAKLNYGDCMAYAVAKSLDVPLLFKGADFGLTDVKCHPASIVS